MAHFAQSFQQPTITFHEIDNIHFDASLLYKDRGIHSLQIYVDKMAINAIVGVCEVTIMKYFVWQIIYKDLFMCGQKKICVICLCTGDDFITNNPFQLPYLDEILNPTKGYMGKKGLPLHDINDVMHSQKHKIQISHEHVHKPKHFHWQPIHNNELKHLITTCPLST
jgi:hypothetical protein